MNRCSTCGSVIEPPASLCARCSKNEIEELRDTLARLCGVFSAVVRCCPGFRPYDGDPTKCPAYREALVKLAALLLFVLAAACGCPAEPSPGATTAPVVDWYGGACEPPLASLCASGTSRGSYVCPSGGMGFYCCDTEWLELVRLQSDGDTFASHCTNPKE